MTGSVATCSRSSFCHSNIRSVNCHMYCKSGASKNVVYCLSHRFRPKHEQCQENLDDNLLP
jgi:hypothetical protein